MSSSDWHYATFRLTLLSPLHAGSWRAGMVAQSHRFVPGHLFSYALAANYGAALGARPEHYATALQTVLEQVRFAPAFLLHQGQLLYPVRDQAKIERHYLYGNNHVTLEVDTRSARDSALFEVEYLSPHCRGDNAVVRATQIGGACWYQTQHLQDRSMHDWLNQLRLGGELKMGYGRCQVAEWQEGAASFHGLGKMQAEGLRLAAGETLPGPALTGIDGVKQQPWLGRLHDAQQGFGRRLGQPILIFMDGQCQQDQVFTPFANEMGLGCWTPAP